MATKRQGMDAGGGSGYRNVIGKDSKVHSDSARGRKQPQMTSDINIFMARMEQAKQKRHEDEAMDKWHEEQGDTKVSEGHWTKKAEPKVKEIKASKENPDQKPSKFWSTVGKAEALAARGARYGYSKSKEYLAEQKKKADERRIQELSEIKHPQIEVREKLQKNIEGLENQIALNEDTDREDELFRELEDTKQKLAEADNKLKNLDLTTLSNEQLKTLAVRHKTEGSFTMSGRNKYEEELLRRITKSRQIDSAIAEAQTKPLKQGSGFFGEFFNPPPTTKKSVFDEFFEAPKKR